MGNSEISLWKSWLSYQKCWGVLFPQSSCDQNYGTNVIAGHLSQMQYCNCDISLPVSVSTHTKWTLFLISFYPAGGQATSPSDASKLSELQKTINSLQEAADQREKQLAEMSARLEEAQRKEVSLQQEKDEVQEENAGLLQNYTRLQASVTELQTRVQEQEDKALQKAQLDHEIQVLRKNLAGHYFWFMLNADTEYCHRLLTTSHRLFYFIINQNIN